VIPGQYFPINQVDSLSVPVLLIVGKNQIVGV